MKRVTLMLACLVILTAVVLPTVALAAEKQAKAAEAKAANAGALIVYPEAPPDATAEQAKAGTEFMKPGDGLNLIVALVSFGAIIAIVVWGIVASRKVSVA